MAISYTIDDKHVQPDEFTRLFNLNWPAWELELVRVESVIERSWFITARVDGQLVGYLRIITDEYIMGVIAEVLAEPSRKDEGIQTELLQLAAKHFPTNLLFAVQRVKEEAMTDLGWRQGHRSYVIRKGFPFS